MTRIVIVGGPMTGKSTLALTLNRPIYCGDPASKARWTDPWVSYLPENLPFNGYGGAAAYVCMNWFTLPAPWVCEGHSMARALRRWLAYEPARPLPCDQVIVMDSQHPDATPKQIAMHKGVMSVWREIESRFPNVVYGPDFPRPPVVC